MGLSEDLESPVNLFDGTHPEEEVQAYLVYIVKWTKIWASLLGIITFHLIALSLFFGYHFWWRRGNEIYRTQGPHGPEDSVLRSWLTPQMQHQQCHSNNRNAPHPDLKGFSKPEEFSDDRRLCDIEELQEKAVTTDPLTSVADLGILDVLPSQKHTWKYSARQRMQDNPRAVENGDRLVMNEATTITNGVDTDAQYRSARPRVVTGPLTRELSFSRPRPRAMFVVDEEVENS